MGKTVFKQVAIKLQAVHIMPARPCALSNYKWYKTKFNKYVVT